MRKAESAKTAYLKRYSRPGFYGRIPKIPTGKFIDELHGIHSCRTGQVGYTRLEYRQSAEMLHNEFIFPHHTAPVIGESRNVLRKFTQLVTVSLSRTQKANPP
ncbi:MAG: hypothetical protein C4331_19155 [Meiothermus sp.]